MTTSSDREQLEAYMLQLLGQDPFAHVRVASEQHRKDHGEGCALYPSDPLSMNLVCLLVRAAGPRRILDIGGGIGYSALRMAEAAGPDAVVDIIEHDLQHVTLAREIIARAGFGQRIQVHQGHSIDVIPQLKGPYEFIYDDGWFMREPAHLEPLLDLMPPQSLLVMANWFTLEDAVLGRETVWSAFAQTDWAEAVQAYSRKLANHPQLQLAYSLNPWLGLAVKLE
ncbi:MAG TPA: class I SAM-dependent methyltransferase [Dehalococcoidia bacterium]|nr:class I SAM-dependent methyltransferase [Dehalococcoidia bacterium]